MLRSKIAAGALIAVVLMTAFVSAQDQPGRGQRRGGPGGFRGGFGGPGMQGGKVMLLGMEEVQKELSVNDDQKKQLEEFLTAAREEMQASFGNFQELRDLSEEERGKRMEEIRAKFQEQSKQADEKLAKILDEKQVGRLNQLQLQREGVNALMREDFAKQLEITEEQQGKLREIMEKSRPQGPGFGGFDPNQSEDDRRAAMQKMREQREKAQADMMAVLTDEQKTKWTELKGKEFDFPEPRFGGGRGGPGGQGRGERQRPRRSENGDNNGNSSETKKDSEENKSDN